MAGYAHINRCIELSEDDIVTALGERRSAKALLERMAKVARPREGASKILVFLARIAGREVDWIDGGMRVEVVAEGDGVVVEVLSELGLGMQERVFPASKVDAPFREFARLVEHMPGTLEPLVVVTKNAKRLALAAVEQELLRGTSKPRVDDTRSERAAATTPASSSGKLHSARRASKPEFDSEMPTRIPPRSGKTLRPAEMAAPAPTRKRTLRPDLHAVPPPVPNVPRAPPLPRVDPDEPGPRRSERPRARGGKPRGDRT